MSQKQIYNNYMLIIQVKLAVYILPYPHTHINKYIPEDTGEHNYHEQIFVKNKDCSILNIEESIAVINQIENSTYDG